MGRIPNTAKDLVACHSSRQLQNILLGGVSILACGIVLARSPAANAQTITTNQTTTVNSTGADITVNPGVLLSGNPGIESATPTGTIANQGSIVTAAGTAVLESSVLTLLSNSGTIASGGFDGIKNNRGSIGTLSNFGTIFGKSLAIDNSGGSVGTLTNNGLIRGHRAVFNQAGTIEVLNNAAGATIAGVNFGTGIYNFEGGNIVTLSNAGLISGYSGIRNPNGTIGQLVNTGTITADSLGVYNAGLIDTITNTGTIAGGTAVSYNSGIYNTGSIGTLTNDRLIGGGATYGIENLSGGVIGIIANAGTGTINGTDTGINNTGSLATLTNSGLIVGTLYAGLTNNETLGTVFNAGTGTIAGGFDGLENAGTIASLVNAGTIAGSRFAGFNNDVGGTIFTLTNSTGGTISGAATGVANAVLIGTLTNAGLISGGTFGIYNKYGTITALTNAGGSITGTIAGRTAISNSGAISTLTNHGTITGSFSGIRNDAGSIGILSNQAGGTIAGGLDGIDNSSVIATLTNAGAITGGSGGLLIAAGIYNGIGATIGQLTNMTIGTIASNSYGIYNNGAVATLTNAGLVSGTNDGIFNNGSITVLTNAAGGMVMGGLSAVRNIGGIGTLSNATGATLAGESTGILSFANIGTLTNAGLISGGYSGVNTGSGTITDLNNSGRIYGGLIGLAGCGVCNIAQLTNTGVIQSDGTGIENYGSIQALNNSGTITGGDTGIHNNGSITTLTNSGTISGKTGILNAGGFIANLTNSGTLKGTETGIYNNGSITTLTNSGSISGGVLHGLYNNNAIDTLINTGAVSGAETGIYNNGSITTLTNSGDISGHAFQGLYNNDVIGAFTNTGTITGGETGIHNNGSIATLTNSGTISGILIALYNNQVIGALINSGTISSGTNAIYSNGGLGTLTNTGLISGNIFAQYQDLNVVGGSGTVFGTLSGGTISLTAADALNFVSGNEILTDDVDNPGGTVTNAGTLQIGFPGAPANITITGNYAQSAAGTLNVIVTPAASSVMNVAGTANLDGAVDYIFAPGTYAPKTYAFISAGSITGTFTSENYDGVPDASTTYSADPTANLVLGTGFALPLVVAPSDSSIFSDQTQAQAQAAQTVSASLLGMAATGGAAASPACEGQVSPNSNAMSGGNIASAIGAELCAHGGWIQADGALGHVGTSGDAAAYNANTAGFLAGIDKLFGATRLGFAIGYDETYLSDKAGGSGTMGTTRVALYGAQPVGPVLLSGVVGYGHAGNSTTRSTGIGGLKENNNLGIVSAALQASTAVSVSGLELIPAAGIRYTNVEAAHFTEASGQNNAFALTGRTKNFNSVQPYATVELTTTYLTPSGYSVAPQATLGLQDEAGNRGAATALYAADGTPFASTHNTLDPLAAILGAGLSASKNNLTVYINYNGLVAGNWNTQSGTAGLRIAF